jgi:hypothetical protein
LLTSGGIVRQVHTFRVLSGTVEVVERHNARCMIR